ncbi:MAG: signal peptidase II [Oscillospiraceae bacterium]|nr:signal peptidase II [Oscillospiraceae bacterium]
MQILSYLLFALAIVGVDQFTKYLTVANIPLHGEVPFLEGILCFSYEKNFGAAFSSFQGMQWLFALIFFGLTAMILFEYYKKPLPFTKFDRWCIAAIWAGGLGNMIDRLRLGYVIDMLKTQFISFPVFNVADSFITCGCIALMVHLVFFNKEFWKDEKK